VAALADDTFKGRCSAIRSSARHLVLVLALDAMTA
jgi:hypothetical protein